ncbi:MAG: 2-oxoglutarate dehydrogenase, E2 component, dihydrolipoamide succinyltransferase [Ignavibacteriales bacterium]|uniref:Dihydrolipoamide acetyltransferase component of pyruvate dehydrogenase complex n=1 Tax=Stygiobacter electus TaxID=3032292 RepID=A0AAE3P059_9BACT|nr:2-oxoglutarate dehydrogenase, E2 component, dihydrolipoamide succinyltransferase [Stygiobacter electus]MBI5809553.1 2-oxoglutarate dehydrogenase, E2 component, dihydrolipoamide succinyltransferase [Ignavibacteriales bacterium]MDF1610628.1 2-oxoglutarate dehydrogenase, E2 component, dihydrolipoamide succinyltransferase [Stygiobacter electus]
MEIEVVMPQMGESITEGTIIKWHKKKGDLVKKDEIIYEISTDKVDTEIPSPTDGKLIDIKVLENETVEVGTVVAIIETDISNSSELKIEEEIIPKKIEENFIPSTAQVGGALVDIPMPKMGESIMDGIIIKWNKSVGDKVQRDEIIFEISTDKVDTEVPSPVDGIIEEILFNENDTVNVGETVARIRTTSGIVKMEDVQKSQPSRIGNDQEEKSSHFEITKVEESNKIKTSQLNRFYSPLVLNIARTENIPMDELENINGTGINGRVTKKDILDYIEKKKSVKFEFEKVERQDFAQTEFAESKDKSSKVQIVPMDNIRQKIMQHMIKSRDTSVHVTAMMEIDMSKIYNFIESNKDSMMKEEGIKLTYLPFISYAVIKALKQFPLMNASIDGNNIVMKNYINLGIAVAVEPNGLIVPNIKNADEKSIRGLAKAIADLSQRARTKKLTTDDITNGTFSITNYGVFGSLFGTPIINQPEVGILGVGAVTKKPVVVEINGNDAIVIKPMMYLSLSHDHRLVDGMLGGKFLQAIKQTLENFDIKIL